MEIAQVVTHLLQREETLRHLRRQMPRQTVVANHGDCCRIGVECGFHAIDAGRKASSEERGSARAKKIGESRSNIRERAEPFLQGLGQGRNGSAANHHKVVAQSEQRSAAAGRCRAPTKLAPRVRASAPTRFSWIRLSPMPS